jgi:hypothetical protein
MGKAAPIFPELAQKRFELIKLRRMGYLHLMLHTSCEHFSDYLAKHGPPMVVVRKAVRLFDYMFVNPSGIV